MGPPEALVVVVTGSVVAVVGMKDVLVLDEEIALVLDEADSAVVVEVLVTDGSEAEDVSTIVEGMVADVAVELAAVVVGRTVVVSPVVLPEVSELSLVVDDVAVDGTS